MANIQSHEALRVAIQSLEQQQLLDKEQMKLHFMEVQESLKPVNVIKSTMHQINVSEVLKKDLIKAAIGLAIGYLAKKMVQTYLIKSKSPISLAVENIIQIVISALITKNGSLLKNIAMHFFKMVLQRSQKQLLLPPH